MCKANHTNDENWQIVTLLGRAYGTMLWREDKTSIHRRFMFCALEGLTDCFQRSTRGTAMNRLPAPAHTAERGLPRSETETRLHGYRLVLMRLLCLTLGVVSVGLFVASIPSYIAHL